MKRVVLLLPTLLTLAFPVGVAGAWGWPFGGGFELMPARHVPGFAYRLLPVDVETDIRTVADGELVFSSPAYDRHENRTSGIPRTTGIEVYAHANGFISGYYLPSRLTMSETIPWLEFVLWDRIAGTQVNPRLLLKHREDLPASALPPIRYVQDGRYVSSDEIASGPLILAVERERFDPTRLPWEIRLIVAGEHVARRRFVFPEELPSFLPEGVGVELFHIEARPGVNSIVYEAERFDRTVVRRTLRFTTIVTAVDGP